jgi:hypothetical protein
LYDGRIKGRAVNFFSQQTGKVCTIEVLAFLKN